jgi:hypothetical protein
MHKELAMTDKTKSKTKSAAKPKPKSKPKPVSRKEQDSRGERFILPRPDEKDTPETFALAIVKMMWLQNHPDKTEADFEEEYRKEEEELKRAKA